ncbi:MAG: SDR family oxidoreductase [Pseudomonadota bacterium]|nr:SDR family oxidoreductase [Pseudomonadota bacterium]
MRIDFAGQVAIVTGAGGGIGRAVCLALTQAGARVLAVDVSEAAARATAQAMPGEARFVAADVSDEAAVRGYVEAALGAWGRLDVFMNNAGWQGEVLPLADYPVEMFDKVMAINVRGVFLGLKHVLPHMVARGRGAVVNTASLGAYIGVRNLAPYAASKHAVLGLTRSAALEVARSGVRVNAVCPGPVDTPMIRDIEADESHGDAAALRAKRAASIPDGRYAEAAEVASLMVYLASDYASHVTGQGVEINGGSHG